MTATDIEDATLGLLVLSPSSFAALYGFVVRGAAGPKPRVHDFFGVVARLEHEGWVRTTGVGDEPRATPHGIDRGEAQREYERWLEPPDADLSVHALAFDPVGLWVEVVPSGRIEFERRHPGGRDALWMIDFDAANETITVHAPDRKTAQRALADWLKMNPQISLSATSVEITPVASFKLRTGGSVGRGVRVEVRVINKRPD